MPKKSVIASKIIGNNLRLLREKNFPDLAKGKVASIIGVSGSELSNWETGYRQPNDESLKTLAKGYDVSPEEIVSGGSTFNPKQYLVAEAHELFSRLLEQLTVIHRAAVGSGKNLRVWVGFLKWLTEILRERGVDALPQEAPAPEQDSA